MIEVVAAIIKNENGEILICQRGAGGSTAFLWEFPGGKRESGESLEECLARECFEELGIEIFVGSLLDRTTYKYPEGEMDFSFFDAQILSGSIEPVVHKQVLWATPKSLDTYSFCPADIDIVNKLQQSA